MKKTILFLALALSLAACDRFKGTPGQDGLNSLVKLQHMAMDQDVCASETGTLINTGLDTNKNGALDTSEVTQGQVVCDGQDGSNGSNGTNGTNGANGTNGTVITTVQFCAPSFVSSYGVFPEIGLCIDDQMIGVYSANGGFLAPLPSGNYSSNGINASCTFTIHPHCVVSF